MGIEWIDDTYSKSLYNNTPWSLRQRIKEFAKTKSTARENFVFTQDDPTGAGLLLLAIGNKLGLSQQLYEALGIAPESVKTFDDLNERLNDDGGGKFVPLHEAIQEAFANPRFDVLPAVFKENGIQVTVAADKYYEATAKLSPVENDVPIYISLTTKQAQALADAFAEHEAAARAHIAEMRPRLVKNERLGVQHIFKMAVSPIRLASFFDEDAADLKGHMVESLTGQLINTLLQHHLIDASEGKSETKNQTFVEFFGNNISKETKRKLDFVVEQFINEMQCCPHDQIRNVTKTYYDETKRVINREIEQKTSDARKRMGLG